MTKGSQSQEMFCGDGVLNLDIPQIMGILNLTEDSFYDGGQFNKGESFLHRAAKMIEQGVNIIDVGAASTRPGAPLISEKDEWDILQYPLLELKKNFPHILLSVDTYNAAQVKKCADLGANIINDISGGSWGEEMFQEVAQQNMAYVMMHIQGKPENMQDNPTYDSVVEEVVGYFQMRIMKLHHLGFNKIILDPGFGFGKKMGHNYRLLAKLDILERLGFPVLVGLSRKSMIFRALNTSPEDALNGTTVLHTLALQNGAKILRVHDVKEAFETIQLFSLYKETLEDK